MRLLAFALVAFAACARGAPFVITASYPATGPQPTHCTYALDGAAKVADLLVARDAANLPYCRFDVGSVATGAHSLVAYAVVVDPVWGRLESPASAPFVFTKPVAVTAPTSLRLVQ